MQPRVILAGAAILTTWASSVQAVKVVSAGDSLTIGYASDTWYPETSPYSALEKYLRAV